MKKFVTIDEVAKEMGIPKAKLRETLDTYESIADGKTKDPWGKKFFSNTDWSDNAGCASLRLFLLFSKLTVGSSRAFSYCPPPPSLLPALSASLPLSFPLSLPSSPISVAAPTTSLS